MTRRPVTSIKLVTPVTHVGVRGKDRRILATLAVAVLLGISFLIMTLMRPEQILIISVADSPTLFLIVDVEVDVVTATLFRLELADVVQHADLIIQYSRLQWCLLCTLLSCNN